jgi:hypothetical protein
MRVDSSLHTHSPPINVHTLLFQYTYCTGLATPQMVPKGTLSGGIVSNEEDSISEEMSHKPVIVDQGEIARVSHIIYV